MGQPPGIHHRGLIPNARIRPGAHHPALCASRFYAQIATKNPRHLRLSFGQRVARSEIRVVDLQNHFSGRPDLNRGRSCPSQRTAVRRNELSLPANQACAFASPRLRDATSRSKPVRARYARAGGRACSPAAESAGALDDWASDLGCGVRSRSSTGARTEQRRASCCGGLTPRLNAGGRPVH